MQIGAPLELARLLLGVQRLTHGVDGLVEVRRGKVGPESVHRAQGEGMRFASGDETTRRAVGVGRLAAVLLERDAAKGEPAPAEVVAPLNR